MRGLILVLLFVFVVIIAVLYAGGARTGGHEDSNSDVAAAVPAYAELLRMMDADVINDIFRANKVKYSKNRDQSEFFRYILGKMAVRPDFKTFIDICACPGMMSLALLRLAPGSRGYGLSLHPSENGYAPAPALVAEKSYNLKYYDVIGSADDPFPGLVVDLGAIGCFAGHNASDMTRKLYARAFSAVCAHLRRGGSMVWTLPYRWSGRLLMDTLELLDRHFAALTITSDTKYTPGLTIAYMYATGFGVLDQSSVAGYEAGQIYSAATLKRHSAAADRVIGEVVKYYKAAAAGTGAGKN